MSDESSELATRPSLLVRLRDPSDATAWRSFADLYTPLVYGYCRHNGLQEADASDVTQEVLTRVARSIKNFEYDPARGRFRDWLGTVARHELSRFIRKSLRVGRGVGAIAHFEPPDPDPAWAEQFHAHVLETALERVRPDFEPATWHAFQRVWLDGIPATEAAAELQESITKIYVAKCRVLKRLRQEVMLLAEDMPLAGQRRRTG